MTTVGRFTSVPSLSGFSMFETPGNAVIVPSGFSFLRNDEARGQTKDEARDDASLGDGSPAEFELLRRKAGGHESGKKRASQTEMELCIT